jgi:hypothetical protein
MQWAKDALTQIKSPNDCAAKCEVAKDRKFLRVPLREGRDLP